jgi:hypothetical protein
MNGGLILGTLDGINIEIMEEIGRENMFIFGSSAEEASKVFWLFLTRPFPFLPSSLLSLLPFLLLLLAFLRTYVGTQRTGPSSAN